MTALKINGWEAEHYLKLSSQINRKLPKIPDNISYNYLIDKFDHVNGLTHYYRKLQIRNQKYLGLEL